MAAENPDQDIPDFHGVYLLCSQSQLPKFKNRNYIGYTVNPNRRILQHNKGLAYGGAKKTSQKGPWYAFLYLHRSFIVIH